jgi:hypothetical protein
MATPPKKKIISAYLSKIGQKGGKSGTGKAKARTPEQARAAVNKRWEKKKNMETKTLKDSVLDMIMERDHVSFAEINGIEGARGEFAFYPGPFPNCILWPYCSEALVKALGELLNEKKIHVKIASSVLVYGVDGLLPKGLPLAKSMRDYKQPHWLPVVFTKDGPLVKSKQKVKEKHGVDPAS